MSRELFTAEILKGEITKITERISHLHEISQEKEQPIIVKVKLQEAINQMVNSISEINSCIRILERPINNRTDGNK